MEEHFVSLATEKQILLDGKIELKKFNTINMVWKKINLKSKNSGEDIRDALEALPEGEKLEINAIENLRKELDELKKKILHLMSVGGAGKQILVGGTGGGGRITKVYDLSASLDGATKTFSLPSFWRVIDVKLSSLPVLRPTTDYTVDGSAKQITFTTEVDVQNHLASGQSLIVIYAE